MTQHPSSLAEGSTAWTVLLHGERVSGSLDVHRESLPDFHDRDASLDASLEAFRLGAGYSWPRTDVMLSAGFELRPLHVSAETDGAAGA